MNLLEKTLFLFFACSASTSFAAMPKQAPHVYSETANSAAREAVQHYWKVNGLLVGPTSRYYFAHYDHKAWLTSRLKKLLLDGANPNLTIDIEGNSLFMFSRCLNDPELLKLCISHGADVTAQNKEQGTALIKAAYYNLDEQYIQAFIKDGKPLDIQDKNGDTALMVACRYGHHTMVKQLLLARAIRTLRDQDGNTAYHAAAENGSIECMRHLLAAHSGTLVDSTKAPSK